MRHLEICKVHTTRSLNCLQCRIEKLETQLATALEREKTARREGMLESLMALKARIEADTPYALWFSFTATSDGEISFEYFLRHGFDEVSCDKYLFNACDVQTNIEGFCDAIDAIRERYKEAP